jgi:hypothetical protein
VLENFQFFFSVVLGRNCVNRAQLLYQFIMFTVNRTSLHNSSIRRDYQFTTDHQKSYLTPNSGANSNADTNADATVDTTGTSKAYGPFETRDANTDSDLYSASGIDSSTLTTPHSRDPSVDPSDSASQTQTLPLIRPRPDIPTRSWVYEHFLEVVIEGKQYTPSMGSKPRTDRRRCCNHCSFKVLDSNRHGTSGLISHLAKHGINKHSTLPTTSIADLLMRAPVSKRQKLSPEQSLVNWVADTFVPFVSIEHPSFHQVIEAHSGTPSVRCGDTVKNHIMKQADSSYKDLRAELEANCSTISLTWDGWTSPVRNIPILAIIGHWISPNFELQAAILEFRRLRGIHSGENMAEVVYEALQDLNLKHKLLAVTGDSASNNGTLVDHLYERLLDEQRVSGQ